METKFQLIAALLRKGAGPLAEHLEVSEGEISKKINGENGWKLEQLAKAFDFAGAHIVRGDEDVVCIPREEYNAYRVLLRKSLQGDGE